MTFFNPNKPIDEKEADRRYHLTVFLVLCAVCLESALAFHGFAPSMSGELVGRIMGTFDSMAAMAVGYYFQSRWVPTERGKKDESN